MDTKLENPKTPAQPAALPKRNNRKQAIVGVLLVAGLAVYVLNDKLPLSPGARETAVKVERVNSEAVLTVELTRVEPRDFERKLLVSGTVWAWDPVQVGSEVNGLKVQSVLVDDGAQVKRGQLLAKLNSSIIEAQLAKKKANQMGAKASLLKAIQPYRAEDLTSLRYAYSQAQANIAQEEANLARAQANYSEAAENAKRYTGLVSQGAVSAEDADNRSTQAKVYLAEVQNCEHKVRAIKLAAQQANDRLTMGVSGGRREDIEISKSQLAEIAANIAELNSQLAQTAIVAPCDGLVLKRSVHIGDISSTSKVMFDLVRDGRLELRANLPEADIGLVKAGQTVRIGNVDARVREISPMIDQDTRLGMVRIDLPLNTHLRPGNFVKGEIGLGKAKVNAVGSSSVVYKDNRAIAYTIDGSGKKVRMHFIEVGGRDGDFIEVLSGLKAGDQVVAKGAGFIKDGDVVNVLGANPSPVQAH